MNRAIPHLLYSLFIGVLVAACAWPLFVASGAAISHWVGEGSIIDSINHVPQQKIMDDFWFGYNQSKLIALGLGVLAALDFFLLSQHKFTWIIAGLSLPVACVGLLFTYYNDPAPLLPTFVMTGVGLFVLYRLADLIKRLVIR